MPWWGWAIRAVIVGLAELQVPGSYLIWIALGAALTAAIDAVRPASVEMQLATFAAAAAACCVAGYFVYRRVDHRRPDPMALNDRTLSMIGARGVVCAGIVNGEGKVRLGDSIWIAEGPGLEEGTPVVVRSVRGTRVVVERAMAVGEGGRSGFGL
jgi:membrane protein implicated in regulation of membrane protease activity